ILQCMGLGDEVVLASHAAEHAAVLQLIGHTGAQQGHGEHRVDEARIATLQALERLLAVQLVDVADTGHGKALPFGLVQLPQTAIETPWPEKESAMHHAPALRRPE